MAVVVLALDLDGFKAVSDQFGHSAGDVLLQVISKRLVKGIDQQQKVVRLGGDEFLVLFPVTLDQAARIGEESGKQLIAALSKPVDLSEGVARVGVSIGLSIWPFDADDLALTTRLADQALYAAKRSGKACLVAWSDWQKGVASSSLSSEREAQKLPTGLEGIEL